MSKIESVSINKKSNKINKSRSQNALEWGQDAAWINKASASNNNGFVYVNTAMGSAQVTAAGIQKFRMD
jgi:hypothetical protein